MKSDGQAKNPGGMPLPFSRRNVTGDPRDYYKPDEKVQ